MPQFVRAQRQVLLVRIAGGEQTMGNDDVSPRDRLFGIPMAKSASTTVIRDAGAIAQVRRMWQQHHRRSIPTA